MTRHPIVLQYQIDLLKKRLRKSPATTSVVELLKIIHTLFLSLFGSYCSDVSFFVRLQVLRTFVQSISHCSYCSLNIFTVSHSQFNLVLHSFTSSPGCSLMLIYELLISLRQRRKQLAIRAQRYPDISTLLSSQLNKLVYKHLQFIIIHPMRLLRGLVLLLRASRLLKTAKFSNHESSSSQLQLRGRVDASQGTCHCA